MRLASPRPPRAPSRAEVFRGNGLGVVLSGVATLVLVSSLLAPWWTYSGPDAHQDSIALAFNPGTTFTVSCTGANCTAVPGPYTYSSAGLSATGSVFEGLESDIGVGLFIGAGCFLVAMIAWVDRARSGAVKTAIAAAVSAGLIALSGPIWLSAEVPTVIYSDGVSYVPATFSGVNAGAAWGPGSGWILALVAAVLFFAAAVSEWSTLRYTKPWDAPLYGGLTAPSRFPPPVTTPPDRIARLELLREKGLISEADLRAQKARILAPENLVGPIPIPPNDGSRMAAVSHLEYLRTSGRYDPEQWEAQKANVLRAYGLSPSLQFPEEELGALVVRFRAGAIEPLELERRKKEILDRI